MHIFAKSVNIYNIARYIILVYRWYSLFLISFNLEIILVFIPNIISTDKGKTKIFHICLNQPDFKTIAMKTREIESL